MEATSEVTDSRHLLIGRERELIALDDAMQRARSGRAQVVVVEGEPGIGKSALLESFVEQEGRDATESVRWLRCDEFEQNNRFGVVARLLGEPLSGASEVEVGRRLLAWFGDQQTEDHTVTVLVLDDAQWMDRASTNALQFAVRRLRADRVLCLVGRRLRPTSSTDLRTEDPNATSVLRPGRLDAGSVCDLARRLRGWHLPVPLAEHLVSRTGGLPLLLAAIVRGAADEQQLMSSTTMPESLAAAVTRMVVSLDPAARRLVEAAAVLAEPLPLTVLGQVADVPDPSAALTAAVVAGLLTERTTGGGDHHSDSDIDIESDIDCAHDLMAEAVRRGLAPVRRRELHLRAAQATTGDRRLAHRAAASDRPDPVLTADLIAAAEVARAALRHSAAATHRLRARAIAPDPVQRESLLIDALVDRVEAEDLDGAAELAVLVGPATPGTRRSLALGLLARERGEVGAARTLLRTSLHEAESAGDRGAATRAALEGAVLEMRIGDGAAAMELIGRIAPHDSSIGAEVATDIASTTGIALWLLGNLDGALAVLDGVARSPGGTSAEAELLAVSGLVRYYEGRPRSALADLDAAVEMMHLWRPSTNRSRIFLLRSLTRFALGDWDGAAVDAGAARALAEGPTQPWSEALAFAVSVDVAAHRGQWAAAEDYLARATESAPALAQITDVVARHAIELARVRGNHHGVLAVLDPLWSDGFVERMARTRQIRPMMVARIAALVAVDRLADAESALEAYEQLNGRWPGGESPAQMGLLRGLIAEARSDPRGALRHYAADLDEPTLAEFPYQRAELLLASGRLARLLGRRRDAVQRLTQARDILAGLRARPLLERCTRELAASGLPSRLDDPLALTPREDYVVALVLRGLSNREVAAELFLTTRTVEYHLRNVYAKLGVRGRPGLRRLRAAAGPDGGAPAGRTDISRIPPASGVVPD